ncbi:MAG: NAD(P)H-dependent oxidoreductase, partial [Oscillospiraceae bacterium]|nr:NAD(P)H-dependent oxidoreductase [Oscillospiraceae bacterium]
MKVLAVNGSPHKDGNTKHMLNTVLEVCEKAGFETEIFE